MSLEDQFNTMAEAVAAQTVTDPNETVWDDLRAEQAKVLDLEARVGRQAMRIEELADQLAQSFNDYHKLIANVAKLLSGEVSLDRFKILEDGLSWQVLPVVTALEPETIEVPDSLGVVQDVAQDSTERPDPDLEILMSH